MKTYPLGMVVLNSVGVSPSNKKPTVPGLLFRAYGYQAVRSFVICLIDICLPLIAEVCYKSKLEPLKQHG
jgi:hypothetical protein